MGGRPTHPRLEVDHDRSRDIVLIVGLVEEDILPVALRILLRPVFEVAGGRDAVFGAEFLPELRVSTSGTSL